jgi:hypothetical protein
MIPGAPARLPSSFPLRRALGFAHPGEPLGAWVRTGRCPLHLRVGGRALLASAELAYLLRRCGRVLVRHGARARVLSTEQLIAWRTLQIVVGAPWLPDVGRLRELYPDIQVAGRHLLLPLGLDGAESVLAACAAERIPVSASWIAYGAGGSG